MPGVHFFPYPYRLHNPLDGAACAAYLDRVLRNPLGGIPLPGAAIIEVVQGEGGVVPAPTDFLVGVRRTTEELGIPLIVDEIQCGCGRTGTWFAFEQHGIRPDVIVASKALGGLGMPVAIVLYDAKLDAWAPGAHTGTFRGNQLAFAAGLESLSIIRRDGILGHVREIGAYALAMLEQLVAAHDTVAEARGAGLMLGLEFHDPQDAAATQRAAFERGLILELGGPGDAVLRMLPALNVSRVTLDQALEILASALRAGGR
jgi:diaminobutyrate-2-oxoglutarate transaminase